MHVSKHSLCHPTWKLHKQMAWATYALEELGIRSQSMDRSKRLRTTTNERSPIELGGFLRSTHVALFRLAPSFNESQRCDLFTPIFTRIFFCY